MKRIYQFAVAIGLIFQSTSSLVAQPQRPTTVPPDVSAIVLNTWTNQLSSTLAITNVNSQTWQISGYYINGGDKKKYPLFGSLNYAPAQAPYAKNSTWVISWSVNWGSYGSITSWAGPIDTNAPSITGQWLLVRGASGSSWDHVVAGQDIFHKQ